MSTVITDDKRLIPEFSAYFWCERVSEKQWQLCKYCGHHTPVFLFTQGRMGSSQPESRMRCCWECGSGLEVIWSRKEGS